MSRPYLFSRKAHRMHETPANNESEAARRSDTAPLGAPTQATGGYSPYSPYSPPAPPAPPPTYQSDLPPHTEYIPNRPPDPPRRSMSTPIAGPVILIAAGIVLLLNNLDILPWAIWGDLWRLWPLALIVIGLDLILGK